MGVYYEKERGMYRAVIKVNGKLKHIGRYKTKAVATRKFNAFKREMAELDRIQHEFDAIRDQPFIPMDMNEPWHFDQTPTLMERIRGLWRRSPKNS